MKSMGRLVPLAPPDAMCRRCAGRLKALRIASTRGLIGELFVPRPITRAEAIAAASVSRTASSRCSYPFLPPEMRAVDAAGASSFSSSQPGRGSAQLRAPQTCHRMARARTASIVPGGALVIPIGRSSSPRHKCECTTSRSTRSLPSAIVHVCVGPELNRPAPDWLLEKLDPPAGVDRAHSGGKGMDGNRA